MVKKLKDKNAPKRPLSSFILFGNQMRKNNNEIKNLPIQEQASAIGKMWRDASEATKEEFNKKAVQLKEEYVRKRKAYEETDEYREFQKMSKEGLKEGKVKKRGPSKMSGYRLFVSECKDAAGSDDKDPELNGKGHMAKCGIKWSRLNESEKSAFNDRASKMPQGSDM